MEIQKVLVTGSDGMIGRWVVRDLNEYGYQVTPVDKYPAQKWSSIIVDCENLGQVVSVMKDHQAVIHLAAIPSPTSHPAEVVFRNNVLSTFNILEAAKILGIKNVVLASSISALGAAFGTHPIKPLYVPIDEKHPLLSQDAYGLSKMVGEVVADSYKRLIPDLCLVSLRFTLIVDDGVRARISQELHGQENMNSSYAGVFWTYVDVRDAATACRLAMETSQPGHEAFYIAAPNLLVTDPIEELLAKYYPGDYPVAAHIRGSASPLDCSKAERVLGWKAVYQLDGTKF